MPKVAICTPTLGPPTWSYTDSMLKTQAHIYNEAKGLDIDVMRPPRTLPIATARQWLAERVMERDHDYLWFIDQDAAFLPGTLERMLSRSLPVVAGLTWVRASPSPYPMVFKGRKHTSEDKRDDSYSACAQEMFDWVAAHYDCETNNPQLLPEPPAGSLFPVDFAGCHCMLIERAVFEAMPPPWFWGAPGTEDKWFCLRAAEYGFGVYVDLSVLVGHTATERTIGALDFIAHARFQSDLKMARDKEAADSEQKGAERRRWKQAHQAASTLRGLRTRAAGCGPCRRAGHPAGREEATDAAL